MNEDGLYGWDELADLFPPAAIDIVDKAVSKSLDENRVPDSYLVSEGISYWVLHNLHNHSNPFIHVDGKQAAHKFTMTAIQKVVGLTGADSANPPREVQEMMKVLHAACHLAPTHVKPNPDKHMLVFIQEFGAFPLRVG